LSTGNIVGISALMHMDNTLKGTNVAFNKNTKQKIIKINSGYFWVPLVDILPSYYVCTLIEYLFGLSTWFSDDSIQHSFTELVYVLKRKAS
jgi:hypothetical protein